MRIRTIKPSFWQHETLAMLPAETRLLALGLLNWADDEGYFLANPALIRGALFPFDDNSTNIRRGLEQLQKAGYIALGMSDDQRAIGRVVNFGKHQRVDRPQPSQIKGSTHFHEDSTNPPRIIDEPSTGEWKGNGREEEGNGTRAASSDDSQPVVAEDLKLSWSLQTGWVNFTDTLMDELAQAYPACHIRRQMLAMEQWLKSNPSKARKSNWRRFVTNWLERVQDRGGDLRASLPAGPMGAKKENGGAASKGIAMPAGDWQAVAVAAALIEDRNEPWHLIDRTRQVQILKALKNGGAAA